MKPTTTWILIADGAHARIFSNSGPGKGIAAVKGGLMEGDHRPDDELVGRLIRVEQRQKAACRSDRPSGLG